MALPRGASGRKGTRFQQQPNPCAAFANTLSVAPRRLHMCRNGTEFVILCYFKFEPEDGQGFVERFGENGLVTSSGPPAMAAERPLR
jgi:hypothetical protein